MRLSERILKNIFSYLDRCENSLLTFYYSEKNINKLTDNKLLNLMNDLNIKIEIAKAYSKIGISPKGILAYFDLSGVTRYISTIYRNIFLVIYGATSEQYLVIYDHCNLYINKINQLSTKRTYDKIFIDTLIPILNIRYDIYPDNIIDKKIDIFNNINIIYDGENDYLSDEYHYLNAKYTIRHKYIRIYCDNLFKNISIDKNIKIDYSGYEINTGLKRYEYTIYYKYNGNIFSLNKCKNSFVFNVYVNKGKSESIHIISLNNHKYCLDNFISEYIYKSVTPFKSILD